MEKFKLFYKLFYFEIFFFFSFFLGLSTKYDIYNHAEFWFLFSDQ